MTKVLAAGAFLPPEFSGRIYSVHAHAINIVLPDRQLLVSLVTRERDLTGLSLLVTDLPADMEGNVAVWAVGRRLYAGPGEGGPICTWAEAPAVFTGSLGTNAARAYAGGDPPGEAMPPRGTLPPRKPSPLRETRRLLELCGRRLAEAGPAGGFGSIGADREPDNRFAVWAGRLLAQGLERLVGLGPGFTPSGDDFVCGALAAREVFSAGGAAEHDLITAIAGRLRATTPAGATLLWLACRRSFPAYLVRYASRVFANGPAAPSDAEVKTAVDEVLQHGATSGADTLSGFLWQARGV